MEVGQVSARAQAIKARAVQFMADELWPLEAEIAASGVVDRAKVDAARANARASGFANLNMPEQYGGLDLPMLDLVAIEEESGKATNGLGFFVADRGPRELLDAVTPEQAKRWALPVVRGEMSEAWAITEPGAGSDVMGIQASAERDGDDWLLERGEVVRHRGDRASYYIVLAWSDGEQTLFLVEKGTPGLEVLREPHFMHDPYIVKHQEVRLMNCRVPDANRVPGAGGDDAKRWFSLERIMIAARCCGAAERLLDLGRDWAIQREAFGHPIANYQGIQFDAGRVADRAGGGAAAHLACRHLLGPGRRPEDRPRQGGHGQALRLRDGEPCRGPQCPALRRARLHDREPGRALLPRTARGPHLGGHQRDSAQHHRARPAQAGCGCVPRRGGSCQRLTRGRRTSPRPGANRLRPSSTALHRRRWRVG